MCVCVCVCVCVCACGIHQITPCAAPALFAIVLSCIMDPGLAFISCPSWDWACDHCDRHATETDNARRWVDARPCGHCGKPMRTWRIRGSHCDIFKPDRSTASPREAKTQERGKQTRENKDQTSSKRWNRRNIKEEAKKTQKLTSSEMVHPQQAK